MAENLGSFESKMAGFSFTQYKTEKAVIYNKENLLNPWFLVS